MTGNTPLSTPSSSLFQFRYLRLPFGYIWRFRTFPVNATTRTPSEPLRYVPRLFRQVKSS